MISLLHRLRKWVSWIFHVPFTPAPSISHAQIFSASAMSREQGAHSQASRRSAVARTRALSPLLNEACCLLHFLPVTCCLLAFPTVTEQASLRVNKSSPTDWLSVCVLLSSLPSCKQISLEAACAALASGETAHSLHFKIEHCGLRDF